jgi:hypothetical protein
MQTAPQPQPQPWKSTVAGVVTLVIGGIDVLAFFSDASRFMRYVEEQIYPVTLDFFVAMLIVAAVIFAVVAVLAILGGISALERKRWGLALAGSIVAIFGPWWPIGITAVVFTALGRDEFKS